MAISTHVVHQELKEDGELKNVAYQAFNKIASLLGKNHPLVEIQEFVNEIDKNGGAKQFFNKKVEHKKELCANKSNMIVDEVDNLVKCMIATVKSEEYLIKREEKFAECTGINILNIVNEFKEIYILTQCLIKDLRASTKKAKEDVFYLTKEIN